MRSRNATFDWSAYGKKSFGAVVGLRVGTVVGDLHRPRRAADRRRAVGVEVVERLAAVRVVGLVGRGRQRVEHVAGMAVAADHEEDRVVRAVVVAHEVQPVHARGPVRRGRERGRGRPVPAVDEAGGGVGAVAALLADAPQAGQGRDEAALRAAVVAHPVDVDVVRSVRARRAGVDLEVDARARVDARRGREALDAVVVGAAGVRQLPPGAAGRAVLDDDRVAGGAGPRQRLGLRERRGLGRLARAVARGHGVEVRRPVRRRSCRRSSRPSASRRASWPWRPTSRGTRGSRTHP